VLGMAQSRLIHIMNETAGVCLGWIDVHE